MARRKPDNAEREADASVRSGRKREAILEAATEIFLSGGYLGTSMDDIAERSGVSKQTVYNNFASKEALFVEIVSGMTDDASAAVHDDVPDLAEPGELRTYLVDYALQQLVVVLTPRVMRLRRLVIGEVARFPELAEVLYERGPRRALSSLEAVFRRFDQRGLLEIEDPELAASQFNWLIISEPLSRAMLLGDEAIPKSAELRRHAEEGVRVFLAAYGRR